MLHAFIKLVDWGLTSHDSLAHYGGVRVKQSILVNIS